MIIDNSLKKCKSREIIFNSVNAQCAQGRVVEKGVNEFSGAAVMLRKATGFKILGRKLTTKFPKRTCLQKLTGKQFFISDFQIVPVKTACHATLPLVKWLPLLPDEKIGLS